MADPYASATDLTDWLPAELAGQVSPGDVPRLLERASARVRARIVVAIDMDNPVHVDALRDATCAVVEQWMEITEANDIDGLAGTQISVTGYSGERAPDLAPRAELALTNAGLGYRGVAS